MRIARASDTPKGPMDLSNFSGGSVERRDYGVIDEPAGTALAVSFAAGARTNWHSHPGGQVLFILEGQARTAVRDGAATSLEPGDLLTALPGEEHWHGAGPDGPMTHLAIQFGDTAWREAVEDGD